jgi:hypothetical protein
LKWNNLKIIKQILIGVIVLQLIYFGYLLSQLAQIEIIQVVYAETTEELKTETPREYAKRKVQNKWGVEQVEYFNKIIQKESNWVATAQNPISTAYGLGQFLNSTWSTVGCEKTSDPQTQIDCTIKYIESRYGTPEKAWSFHIVNNYY